MEEEAASPRAVCQIAYSGNAPTGLVVADASECPLNDGSGAIACSGTFRPVQDFACSGTSPALSGQCRLRDDSAVIRPQQPVVPRDIPMGTACIASCSKSSQPGIPSQSSGASLGNAPAGSTLLVVPQSRGWPGGPEPGVGSRRAVKKIDNDTAANESSGGFELVPSLPSWQYEALRVLLAGLDSPNVKVRWNACYAVGTLFQRQRGLDFAARAGHVESLLRHLLRLALCEDNVKVGPPLPHLIAVVLILLVCFVLYSHGNATLGSEAGAIQIETICLNSWSIVR